MCGRMCVRCWSYVGHQGGRQDVSLRSTSCLYIDTVQHEVLHALGFHHEQVRSDRDAYVTILSTNIRPGLYTHNKQLHFAGTITGHKSKFPCFCLPSCAGMEDNFRIEQTNNLDTPYDFDSVMHYSK